jgi:hypothetical protein
MRSMRTLLPNQSWNHNHQDHSSHMTKLVHILLTSISLFLILLNKRRKEQRS